MVITVRSRLMMRALSVLALLLAAQVVRAEPVLKPGERLVFYGDSITEQRRYTTPVMVYLTLRYPEAHFTFRNAGWSGDRAPGALGRLQRDVLSQNPNVVSMCFGMNDGGYKAFDDAGYATYMTGITGLKQELKNAGAKVVLLTPGCVDLDRRPNLHGEDWNYNQTLGRYAEGVLKLADQQKLPSFDLFHLMMDVQGKAKEANPQFTMIPDSVHPDSKGGLVMAYALIQGLGCTQPAADLVIDAAAGKATAQRCQVKDLQVTADRISFTRTDDALPFCDPNVAEVAKYLPAARDLFSRYPLKVTGLKGNWTLTVGDQTVGQFSAEELAAGVDLSGKPGPWKDMTDAVTKWASELESAYFARWRQVSLAQIPAEAKPELDALLKKLDDLIAAKDQAIAPIIAQRTWNWTLTQAK